MLKTAVGYQEPKWQRASVPVMGGLNLDANEATLPETDLSDCFNLRQQRPGEIEIRSGYHKHPNAIARLVICKCEYRSVDTIFDVTFVQNLSSGAIDMQMLNRSIVAGSANFGAANKTIMISALTLTDSMPTVSPVATPIIGSAAQYGNMIMLTLYDNGIYAIFPTETNTTPNILLDAWTIKSLGKGLTPTPYYLDFAATAPGDLWAYIYDEDPPTSAGPSGGSDDRAIRHFTPKLVAGQKPIIYEYQKIPAKITYYLASGAGFDPFNQPYYEYSTNDPNSTINSDLALPALSGRTNRIAEHLQRRSYSYRFAVVRKFYDGRGGTVIFRDMASADICVPNVTYSPPQLLTTLKNGAILNPPGRPGQIRGCGYNHFVSSQVTALVAGTETAKEFTFITYNDNNQNPTDHDEFITAVPDAASMQTMCKQLIAYSNRTYSLTTPPTVYRYPGDRGAVGAQPANNVPPDADWVKGIYFTIIYTGYREIEWFGHTTTGPWIDTVADQATLVDYESDYSSNLPPYVTEFRASDLFEAPMTLLTWKMFSTTDGTTRNPNFPADAVEIEVYRTAWESSEEVFGNNKDPLFQPHLYGYVGSIKSDKDFTDNIKDTAIDFGKRPETQDGYLTGQFSGQVIREYNRKLVIGNVSTNYWVNAPSLLSYSFSNTWSIGKAFSTLRTGSPTTRPRADLNTTLIFYIAYVDKDGNQSDATRFSCVVPHTATTFSDVFFQVPRGYSPSITQVRFLVSTDSGVTIHLLGNVPVTQDYATYTVTQINAAATAGSLTKDTVNTKEPGALIWSKANQPFFFPPTNVEVINKTAGVTFMEAILGPLWVWTDRSVDLSTIDEAKPRGEEESMHIGCISRFAAAKVDKVVFFLSASGLYIAAADGVIAFPAKIQTTLLQYLKEEIAGQPPMANMKRASIGWNNKRNELWISLPGSTTLTLTSGTPGLLPGKIFVIRFFDETYTHFGCYETEIVPATNMTTGALRTDAPNGQPVIFQSHLDGKLFCSFNSFSTATSGVPTAINTIDNDCEQVITYTTAGVPTLVGDWDGCTAWDKPMSFNNPTLIKRLRQLLLFGDFTCNMQIMTGAANSVGRDSTPNSVRGIINSFAGIYPAIVPAQGLSVPVPHRIPQDIKNSTASAPYIRVYTKPLDANHKVRYKGFDVFWAALHNHPY